MEGQPAGSVAQTTSGAFALEVDDDRGGGRWLSVPFDHKIVAASLLPFVVFVAIHANGGLPLWLATATLFLGAPHVLATVGLYLDRDIRSISIADPLRFIVVPLAIIPLSVVLFGITRGAGAVLLVTAFFLWQTQHYTKQNVGMFAFWCKARGLGPMAQHERALIRATTAVGVIGILRAMELVPAADGVLQMIGIVLMVVGAGLAMTPFRGARSWALLGTVVFYAPLFIFRVDLLAAAFAYQAAHGLQYYLMVGHVIRRNPVAMRITVPVVLLGGVVPLALLTPTTLASAPLLFGLAKGIAGAHFLADASLWKLRNPQVRAVMRERFAFL